MVDVALEYKDKDPKETIKRIKKIFDDLGCVFKIDVFKITKEICEAAVYLDQKRPKKALKTLKNLNPSLKKSLIAVIRDLELQLKGFSEEDRDYIIQLFFRPFALKTVKIWRYPRHLLALFGLSKRVEEKGQDVETDSGQEEKILKPLERGGVLENCTNLILQNRDNLLEIELLFNE